MHLPPELLRQISGRLHHAVDFVRFHAVCRPWRDSYDGTVKQQFLPWLLTTVRAESSGELSLMVRCVFSNTSYTAPPVPPFYLKWVANADGTSVGYLADRRPYSSLHNPFTGATTPVPAAVPDGIDNLDHVGPYGVVYEDGTMLLYSCKYEIIDDRTTSFVAALRRPGDAAWTVIERTLDGYTYGNFCIAYHGGNIFVSAEARQRWHVVTPSDNSIASDLLIPSPLYPTKRKLYFRSGHVMEHRGELLWATVRIPNNLKEPDICNVVQALSLSVYMLQEEVSAPKKMQWVRKDNLSLANLILFLGRPYSFAVDASRLGASGGCAYFVYSRSIGASLYQWSAVFRYNLIDNKAEFVESLPQDWHDGDCAWLIPQPTIAAIAVTTM